MASSSSSNDSSNDTAISLTTVWAEWPVWPVLLWRNHTRDYCQAYNRTGLGCFAIQTVVPDKVDAWQMQLLFGIAYSLVWACGVIGNGLVLYCAGKRISFTIRTVFITSLAMSDVAMCMTSLPITAMYTFTRDWIFPSFFCKLIGVVQGGSIFISTFTLTAIAIDRYFLITRPTDEVISYHRALGIVASIWVLGYALAMPWGVFAKVIKFPGLCGRYCEETWPSLSSRMAYGISVLTVQFGLPIVVNSICYWAISRTLESQIAKRCENQAMLPESEARLVRRKNRTNRMMVTMVITFIVAWLPLNFANICRDITMLIEKNFNILPGEWFMFMFTIGHLIAMTSAIANPLIYGWFNPQFRSALKYLLGVGDGTHDQPSGATKTIRTHMGGSPNLSAMQYSPSQHRVTLKPEDASTVISNRDQIVHL